MLELESALLVSDVHLSETESATAELFFNFLVQHAPKYKSLVILGDLFDAWPGDDILDQAPGYTSKLVQVLSSLEKSGLKLCFMAGNRDFLLKDAFARQTGLTLRLLPDPSVMLIAGQAILLAHGDAYCTDDTEYQTARKQLRSEEWQTAFLAKSLDERLGAAKSLRAQSETAKLGKPMDIMDVNPQAIAKAFSDHQVSVMIHGHTHRPGSATHEGNKRYILPDWQAAAPGQARRGGGIGISKGRGIVTIPI